MFFQRGFRGSRGSRTQMRNNPFHQRMKSIQRYAQSNPFFSNDMKAAFGKANTTLRTLETQNRTFNTGAKETYVDSQLQHRIVGRDAMIQARESERKNENNPLLRSVETLPHQFSRREMKTVVTNVVAMDEEKPTITYKKTMPLNEPKYSSVKNNTDVKGMKKYKCTEYKANPQVSDDLDQKIPTINKKGSVKRTRPEMINVTAPVLNERQKDQMQSSKLREIMTKAKVSTLIQRNKRRKYVK